ncbi:VOC family protein [Solirubrum puertoriconensis]|uniref:VOC domain-containing protein n=1 Tax=Solirubrum puertoriconensis TaxID=1751427 RepID=A0A9X0L5M6_SOLP1|nr:glyoxalase/bleomycin resistance/dioxygenase family protein [Solirubrum puertoriconensis]KUG08777.1 hypothetical protein ASU33_11635 [Solirubrum puertoriconensis]
MQLQTLCLLAPDLPQQKHFYGEVLGLPTQLLPTEELEVHLGFSRVVFRQAVPGTKPYYHFALTVPHNQLQAAYGWLAARTPLLPFLNGEPIADFPNWQAQAFYFYDPAGNILECIARFELPNATAEPFGPTHFLGLSEAGIVTDNVPRTGATLAKTHGIPDFCRGPKLPNFAAMGTDEGLLILTQEGRGWLPTGQPAEQHWLRLEGSHAGKSFTIEVGPNT